ncbi:hypothetical protein Kpol_1010p35 [Vanderwaltozyma polyspora DSM 70294]|uniref:Signal peptidase complex subunit 1 n=1 Tax=Vanderwaltozyma polyspora (strain ATCC 22028 / DSM 70294 / BCRC 21397 / CBS 2163 / NBRC 10782 / NRRL Y-8283 / UCD 57-17) TaxID=436907 RepID=A7TII1_VANPO|nr:uncharacterized protein Kpol_1010p35 [Vanderwaltozyma polyspora DSM 70294]EDO17919.1 hypothetical protein Kpol_1010p35 [Vanderwaltozyma polyspora DSM 70294]
MSDILQEVGKKLVFPIDFQAQKEVSKKLTVILSVGVLFTSIYGYITQSLFNLLVAYGVIILVASLVIVPAYPSYNKHKLQWVTPKVVQ